MKVDVQDLGCDWYVFSGHKMLGPSGIGLLWGKKELLEEMDPFMFGGEMIREVRLEDSTFNEVPYKFEAGTPHIAGAIGLGAAVNYLDSLGMDKVREHEKELIRYALEEIGKIGKIRVIGPTDAKHRSGVMSFNVGGVHPHDVAQVLDSENVYVRAGHHCAMPLHTYLGLIATVRASFYVYNTKKDVDRLVEGIEMEIRKFK
jgi:cysteine desulfurase/selenocysteine lyase